MTGTTSMTRTFFLLALGLSAAACGGGDKAAPADATTAANAAATAGYFTVPDAQRSHLEIAAARTVDEPTSIHTTGTVDWDNDQTTQAITQVNGPITRIMVDLGTRVKAGDPLLFVASPDIAAAVSTYRKAKNRLDQAQRTVDRNKTLLEHKAIAQRDFDDSQSDYNDAATDLQTAMQSLKILGVNDTDLKDAEAQTGAVRSELPMRSPIAGVVVQKLVFPGQVIQAGATQAFTISDISTVWVQAHVYDKDLSSISVGDAADVRSSAFPDVFHGRVASVGDLLDPATRTTLVRIVTANPRGVLKKDLFVDVSIAGPTRHKVLVVPTSAILYDEQNLPFVYVDAGQNRFMQRTISIGAQQGADTEITAGLKPDDHVVGQGSLFLQFANTIGK
jgi:cobalt-zinc-cadmium efflux system membrane fusion protein